MVNKKNNGFSKQYAFQWVKQYFLVVVVLLLVLVFAVVNKNFLTASNIQNMLRQASANTIISLGMLAVVITGGIDLSVGATSGLAGVLVAGFLRDGMGALSASLLVLLIGIFIGIITGFLIVYMRIAPYIATMSMMLIVTGIKLVYSHSLSIPISIEKNEWFIALGRGDFLGIPVPVWLMFGMTIVAQYIMSKTTYGRSLYALGGNPQAAYLAGINNNFMTMSVYVVSALFSFVAGIMLASRLASGSPSTGTGFDTNAIASVVIGGASLAGGRGKPAMVLFGALVIAMLNNFLNLMGVQNYIQRIITGVIIIIAVFATERSNVRKR